MAEAVKEKGVNLPPGPSDIDTVPGRNPPALRACPLFQREAREDLLMLSYAVYECFVV